jgi:hypothetical protein
MAEQIDSQNPWLAVRIMNMMNDGSLKDLWGGALAYKNAQYTQEARWQMNALIGHDGLLVSLLGVSCDIVT